MKKLLCSIAAASLILCGCSKSEASQVSSVKEVVKEDYGVWLMKPEKDYTAVSELNPKGQGLLQIDTQKFGHLDIAYEMEMDEYPSTMADYTSNAVIVERNNRQGMINMSGKQLLPVDLDVMNSSRMAGISYGWKKTESGYEGVFAITSQIRGKAYILSKDCKSTEEISLNEYSSVPPTQDYAAPYLALQNGVFGVVAMTKTDSGATSGWDFEQLDPSVIHTAVVIDTVDEFCNTLHRVIYDPSSDSVSDLSSIGVYSDGSFVNGYYQVTDSEGLVSVIDAASQQAIAQQYQRAGIPQEGYIPLRKYGKWGYMSLDGKEVTDFIFEDARAVNNGYAYVKYDGKWGILKFEKTLKSGQQINISSVSSACIDQKMGEVEVIIDGLTIREGHSSDSTFIGNACYGSVYPYYETVPDGGYTWYRVSENAWLADSEGQWLKNNG